MKLTNHVRLLQLKTLIKFKISDKVFTSDDKVDNATL